MKVGWEIAQYIKRLPYKNEDRSSILRMHVSYLGFHCYEERHYDCDDSYKGKGLIGAGLQFQRFSPLSS